MSKSLDYSWVWSDPEHGTHHRIECMLQREDGEERRVDDKEQTLRSQRTFKELLECSVNSTVKIPTLTDIDLEQTPYNRLCEGEVMTVTLAEEDVITAAIRMTHELRAQKRTEHQQHTEHQQEVFVLSMANPEFSGGPRPYSGSSQEEAICRCTSLPYAINLSLGWQHQEGLYPFRMMAKVDERCRVKNISNHDHAGLYTPHCVIIRHGEDRDFQFVYESHTNSAQSLTCAVASVAGLDLTLMRNSDMLVNDAQDSTVKHLDPCASSIVRSIIISTLEFAAESGHEHLLLGALGCQTFMNPMADVLSLFYRVLHSPRYSRAFTHVHFALGCKK